MHQTDTQLTVAAPIGPLTVTASFNTSAAAGTPDANAFANLGAASGNVGAAQAAFAATPSAATGVGLQAAWGAAKAAGADLNDNTATEISPLLSYSF